MPTLILFLISIFEWSHFLFKQKSKTFELFRANTHLLCKGKYHCGADHLFDCYIEIINRFTCLVEYRPNRMSALQLMLPLIAYYLSYWDLKNILMTFRGQKSTTCLTDSVTRFGEISPLWHKLKWGWFSIWQKLLPTLNFFGFNWAIFHCRKWTYNENYKSHLVTLLTVY